MLLQLGGKKYSKKLWVWLFVAFAWNYMDWGVVFVITSMKNEVNNFIFLHEVIMAFLITNFHHYITHISCFEDIKRCFCLCYVCGLETFWEDIPKANGVALKKLPNGNEMMMQKDIVHPWFHLSAPKQQFINT